MATKLIDPYALKVYAVINSFTQNSKEKCFKGSNKYLSIVTGISEKTVKKKISILLSKEWVLTNGYQNELRRLQAVPVEFIDELQREYTITQKTLSDLTKSFTEGKTPLEEWLEKKSKERKDSPNGGADVPKDKNERKDEDNGVSLDGDDVPEETTEIPHSDTSDKTSEETSSENSGETSSDTDDDQGEDKLDDAIDDLFDIDDDSSLNFTPPTKDDAKQKEDDIEVEYSNQNSRVLELISAFKEKCIPTRRGEMSKQFKCATGKQLIVYEDTEPNIADRFQLLGDESHRFDSVSFDRDKYFIINSNMSSEVISFYEN